MRLVRFSVCMLLIATFTGCNLNALPNTTSISGAPLVQFVSPQAGAFMEGVSVNVQAQVTNAGADIDRVEIAIDDTLAATITDPNPDGDAAFAVTHGWLAAGLGDHRIAVTAFRGDGSASEPAAVTITIVEAGGRGGSNTQETTLGTPSPQSTRLVLPSVTPRPGQATQAGQPTQAPQSTVVPTTAPTTGSQAVIGSGAPTVSFTQGINVRRGPGLEFDPPIGAYAAGQSAEILAVSTGGDWYKVRYGGGEGWVYGPLVTVNGDTSSLPREAGPPRPTPRPATATSAAPTQLPAAQSGANLVAGIIVLNPQQPTCNQTFTVGFDVANLGTEATNGSGTISLVDVRAADGSTQGQTIGGFPVIAPGQTFRVDMPLTVSTWYGETHRITLTIDPGNTIPESNPNDNAISIEYTLARGDCP